MTTLLKTLAVSALALAASGAMAHQMTTEVSARIDASSTPEAGELSLAEVRAATERFRDVKVALAEGYLREPTNMCETASMMNMPRELGGMGIHFFRPDLLGITAPPNPQVDGNGTHTNFSQPSILIYDPHADGSLGLVAVENLVFIKGWEAAGNTDAPSFHGVAFDTMQDDPATAIDEAHGFEPHYDRHVWLYRENANGVFAQFNPTVTCEHHKNGAAYDDSSS